MAGVNAYDGSLIDGFDHVVQSIRDILLTPIGTRVMLRDYGSRLPGVLDHPLNAATVIDATMAAAEALNRWEPRFRLRYVEVISQGTDGVLGLALTGTWYPRGHLGDFTPASGTFSAEVLA